jgi:hypothetical protein
VAHLLPSTISVLPANPLNPSLADRQIQPQHGTLLLSLHYGLQFTSLTFRANPLSLPVRYRKARRGGLRTRVPTLAASLRNSRTTIFVLQSRLGYCRIPFRRLALIGCRRSG